MQDAETGEYLAFLLEKSLKINKQNDSDQFRSNCFSSSIKQFTDAIKLVLSKP